MSNVIDNRLARAAEEAFMARGTAPSPLRDLQDHWTECLLAGSTPPEAAVAILEAHAAAICAEAPHDATDYANLLESLIADTFAPPATWPLLQRIAWLWQAGHTTGRPDDEPVIYAGLALLVVADRGGADVQDLLERTLGELGVDDLAEA